jgi:hypothetical protein
MRRSTCAGFSPAALALLAVVIIGAAAASAIFFAGILNANVSSSSPSSTSITGSATSSVSSTSSSTVSSTGFTDVTSSMASTHTTSFVSSGSTAVTSTSASTVTFPQPTTELFAFGAEVNAKNSTTETVPASTIAWTSWTLNATTNVFGANSVFLQAPVNDNSSVTIALYTNGKLAGNETYPIYTPQTPPGSKANSSAIIAVEFLTVMILNRTAPAGAVISLAVLSPTPITLYFNDRLGVPTYEASVASGSFPPTVLPSPSSSLPDTAEIYAVNTG